MGKKYEYLLLDLDETLIDNKESIRYAFKKVLEQLGINYNDNYFNDFYNHDCVYWNNVAAGKVAVPDYIKSKDKWADYLRTNFLMTFFGIDYDKANYLYNNIYAKSLAGCIVATEPNLDYTISELSNSINIVISTNGHKDAALKKIKELKIEKYILKLITSGEAGFMKNSSKYYDYLMNIIGFYQKDKMLIVGDSLESDIMAGNVNNIDSCWYNPNFNKNNSEYVPNYEINEIKTLIKIL